VVANYFDRVGDKVFRCQPRFDVVSRDPRRKVAQKYSEAHSVIIFAPLVGMMAQQGEDPISAY
jgi:hypothetical protein